MHALAAQIMETALALQRAPGERFRLRERALPAGLVHVLEIASGAPTAVREAAADLGESERSVLEASRFFLEQMLFASPQADAYRILGVAPTASQEEIRTHHRWLQRWLHPDRAQAGDASVFATRVNQAWSRLRTPEARHQYDVELAEARMSGASAPLSAATIRQWQFEQDAPRHGARSRWLLAAALLSCAVLAVLVVRHGESVEPWEQPGSFAVVQPVPVPGPEAASPDPVGPPVPAVAKLSVAMPAPEPPAKPDPVPTAAPAAIQAAPRVATPRPATVAAVEAEAEVAKRPARILAAAREPEPAKVAPTHPAPAPAAPTPAVVEPALPAPVAIASAAPVPAPEVASGTAMLLERMRKAEQRVAQLTAYLAAEPQAAPLWNDVQTQAAADRVRDRIAIGEGARLEFATPNWRLQPENASLSIDYRCASCALQAGRLDVTLVWRQGLWLVRGVTLAPSA